MSRFRGPSYMDQYDSNSKADPYEQGHLYSNDDEELSTAAKLSIYTIKS